MRKVSWHGPSSVGTMAVAAALIGLIVSGCSSSGSPSPSASSTAPAPSSNGTTTSASTTGAASGSGTAGSSVQSSGASAPATAGSALPTASGLAAPDPQAPAYSYLPDDVKKRGYIVVATDPQFGPPTNFHPKDQPDAWAGLEPDLLRAIEPKLGVPIHWNAATFETIIPGIKSGRFDIGADALQDTVAREQQVTMVDWWKGFESLIVQRNNPQNIQKLTDACGKKIGVVGGSTEQAFFQDFSAKNCGSSPIDLLTFKARPDILLALQAGKVAATSGGTGLMVNLQYNLDGTQSGALKYTALADKMQYMFLYAGLAVNTSNTALQKALTVAIQAVMDDGTYKKVLDTWHLTDANALSSPLINGASTKPLPQ
jgi:polar amino acid transport system substrate-binding protein